MREVIGNTKADIVKNNKEAHYLEYFLPFCILLSPYRIGIISMTTIGLFVVVIMNISRNDYKFVFYKRYWYYLLFFVACLFKDIIRMVFGNVDTFTSLKGIAEYSVMYLLIFISANQEFDEDILYKVWRTASIIYIGGLAYHLVQLYVFKTMVFPISLIPGYSIRDVALGTSIRPSSFFSESSAFVWAEIPMEFLALKRKDFKWAIIITVAILLSTSSEGVVLSALLWSLYILNNNLRKSTKIIYIIIGLGIAYFFATNSIFEFASSKLLTVAQGKGTFGSRVQTGFDVIRTINISGLPFGTLYDSGYDYISQNYSKFASGSMALIYYSADRVFLNTFSLLILKYGIVGAVLYYFPFLRCIRKEYYGAKALLIVFCIATIAETMFMNSVFYMIVLLSLLYERLLERHE